MVSLREKNAYFQTRIETPAGGLSSPSSASYIAPQHQGRRRSMHSETRQESPSTRSTPFVPSGAPGTKARIPPNRNKLRQVGLFPCSCVGRTSTAPRAKTFPMPEKSTPHRINLPPFNDSWPVSLESQANLCTVAIRRPTRGTDREGNVQQKGIFAKESRTQRRECRNGALVSESVVREKNLDASVFHLAKDTRRGIIMSGASTLSHS